MKSIVKVIAILMLFTQCENPNKFDVEFVKSRIWVFDSGDRLNGGDFIFWDSLSGFSLSGDTLFYAQSPVGIITSVDKKRFSIRVKNMESNKEALYLSTNQSEMYS